ncbi:MAG: D-alanyl-D-alanine carboxypeptidase [SAR324 cluster bacterium]|nr:D-alanyl-D-alanine carboxypeptidase [SAR324 cluster bacterium]
MIIRGLFTWWLIIFSFVSWANSLDQEISRYITRGSVLVANDEKLIYSFQKGSSQQVPASILKIATSMAALHFLGPDYHFKTEFYLRSDGDLLVRGYGDPFLVSEQWIEIVKQLQNTPEFPQIIRNILLDASSFSPDIHIDGVEQSLNPYDAKNGALVTNFNTINVIKHKDGSVISAEKQTPLTPLARKLAAPMPYGSDRINISPTPEHILPYLGELFKAFLEQTNYRVTGTIREDRVKPEDRLILTFYNPNPLTQTLKGMLHYSNNFTANQLMLTIGMRQKGEPATLEKGMSALNTYFHDYLSAQNPQFVEASGISRKNLVDPHWMITVLKAFRPHMTLLSLKKGIYLKTGTLKGVYSLAGYLPFQKDYIYFVIILNQSQNNRNQILDLLIRNFSENRTFQ